MYRGRKRWALYLLSVSTVIMFVALFDKGKLKENHSMEREKIVFAATETAEEEGLVVLHP